MSVRIAAAVQMSSGEDKQANLATAERLIRSAVADGAQIVALPEMFNCLGRFETIVAAAEPIPGPTSLRLSNLAKELGITLLAGSICERTSQQGRGYNTSLLFAPDGSELARYRKIHLFDVNLPGVSAVRESHWIEPGDQVVTAESSFGRVGLSICYDLRFAELYRAMAAKHVCFIFVPSAFTATTGRDHWEVLLRARAIENQAYVIAPNQWGRHTPHLETFGHSMIVDPWGESLASLAEGEGVVLAELDAQRLQTIRTQLPALEHRRIP